jgi:hypothetical protein
VTNGIKYSCQIFKIVSISTQQFEGTTTILLKEKETSFALYYMKESKAKKRAPAEKLFARTNPTLIYIYIRPVLYIVRIDSVLWIDFSFLKSKWSIQTAQNTFHMNI